jgi:hypothetical protein
VLVLLTACARGSSAGSDDRLGTIHGEVLLGPTCPVESIQSPCPGRPLAGQNTSIGVVATNVALTKTEATKVAQMAHDGLARAIRPVHTPWDGDALRSIHRNLRLDPQPRSWASWLPRPWLAPSRGDGWRPAFHRRPPTTRVIGFRAMLRRLWRTAVTLDNPEARWKDGADLLTGRGFLVEECLGPDRL